MINSFTPPAPPLGWGVQVPRMATSLLPAYLAYVFGQVLVNGRGGVLYEQKDDHFILYLKPDFVDVIQSPLLTDFDEVWVAFAPKFGMKG